MLTCYSLSLQSLLQFYMHLCHDMMQMSFSTGKYEEAICEHEKELFLCTSHEDWIGVAIAHRRIGECHAEKGDYDKALQHQKKHLKLAQKCDSLIEKQRAYATIGRTHYQCAEKCANDSDMNRSLQKAEDAFRRSLETCEVLKDSISMLEYNEMKSRLLLNLGTRGGVLFAAMKFVDDFSIIGSLQYLLCILILCCLYFLFHRASIVAGLVNDSRGDVKECAEFLRRAIQIAEYVIVKHCRI